MNRGLAIANLIKETEVKIDKLYKNKDRKDPIDADIEVALKSMAYIKIKEIMQK